MELFCYTEPTMRPHTLLAGIVIVLGLLLPQVSGAATPEAPDPVLRQLYLSQIQAKKPNAALEKRIANERLRLRQAELKELTALVDAAGTGEEETGDTVRTAIKQQQALVDMLAARRQETQVDGDLLEDEEAVLDDNADDATGNALAGVQRRKADLLARRARLEERLSAIEEVLEQQEDRLDRLSAQERTEVFVNVIQIGIYIGFLILFVVIERLIRNQLIARIQDRNRRYLVMKLFTGTAYILLFGWILYRLAADFPGIVTSFAIVGAGIAVALQSVIKDIVGWIIIMQKRLFRIGQRVTIGPFTGDVADISLLRTTIVEVNNATNPDLGRSGQTLYLPNSMVLEGPVLNFHATSDFMEAEIPVTVPYGSDWKKAEEMLRLILKEEVGEYVERARFQHQHRTAHFFASQEPPEPRVFTDISADGILFTLRFQIPIGRRRMIVSAISHKILERFSQANPPITIAYKTMTLVK